MPYANKEKQREAQRKWARKNRLITNKHRDEARRVAVAKVRELKEVASCVDCGIKYPYYVMQYDHTDDDKVKSVSKLVHGNAAWSRVGAEIEKCDLVCGNCHAERTHQRSGFLA